MATNCSSAKNLPPKMRLFFASAKLPNHWIFLKFLANLTPIFIMEEGTKTLQHVNQITLLKIALRILILVHFQRIPITYFEQRTNKSNTSINLPFLDNFDAAIEFMSSVQFSDILNNKK